MDLGEHILHKIWAKLNFPPKSDITIILSLFWTFWTYLLTDEYMYINGMYLVFYDKKMNRAFQYFKNYAIYI